MLSFDLTSAFKLEIGIVSKSRIIEELVLKTAKQLMIFIKQVLIFQSIIVIYFSKEQSERKRY